MDRTAFNAYWAGKGHEATDTDYRAYQLGQQASQQQLQPTVEAQQRRIAEQIRTASNKPLATKVDDTGVASHHPQNPYKDFSDYQSSYYEQGYGVTRADYDHYLRSLGLTPDSDHDKTHQQIHKNNTGSSSISKGIPDHVHDQHTGARTSAGAGSDFTETPHVHHDSIVPGWTQAKKNYGEDRGPPPVQTQGESVVKPAPKPTRDTAKGGGSTKPAPPAPADTPPPLPKQRTQTYPYPCKNLPFDPTRLPPELGDPFYSDEYQTVLQKWGRDNFDRYEKKQPLLPKPLPPKETMIKERKILQGKQPAYADIIKNTIKNTRFIPAKVKLSIYTKKKPYYMEINGKRQFGLYDIQGNLFDETGPKITNLGYLNESEGFTGAVDTPEKIRAQAGQEAGIYLLLALGSWGRPHLLVLRQRLRCVLYEQLLKELLVRWPIG